MVAWTYSFRIVARLLTGLRRLPVYRPLGFLMLKPTRRTTNCRRSFICRGVTETIGSKEKRGFGQKTSADVIKPRVGTAHRDCCYHEQGRIRAEMKYGDGDSV